MVNIGKVKKVRISQDGKFGSGHLMDYVKVNFQNVTYKYKILFYFSFIFFYFDIKYTNDTYIRTM